MKLIVILFFLIIYSGRSFCQNDSNSDLDLVAEKAFEKPKRIIASKPKFGYIGKSAISKYNPISLMLSSALYTYQKVMSGQLSSNCPYELSCSNFAKASLYEFGLFKGTALAVDRMLRCNKISAADIHPIRFNEKGKVADFPSYYRLEH